MKLDTTAVIRSTNTPPALTFEEQVLLKLDTIITRLDGIDERIEAVEVRLSDMDLDTGSGFDIDG